MGWAVGAARLMEQMAALPPGGRDDLAPGFVVSAAVLRHLQADSAAAGGVVAGRVAGCPPPGGVRPVGRALPRSAAEVGAHRLTGGAWSRSTAWAAGAGRAPVATPAR